jgi:hypothetical protein
MLSESKAAAGLVLASAAILTEERSSSKEPSETSPTSSRWRSDSSLASMRLLTSDAWEVQRKPEGGEAIPVKRFRQLMKVAKELAG